MSPRPRVRAPHLLLCGHVTLDRVGGALLPGGSAFYAGRAARALGARVSVLTAAAADFPREALADLDAEVVPAAETTVFENVHLPDGSRHQRLLAAAPPLDPAALPERFRGADALLLAPVFREVSPAGFQAAAGARRVGLCAQGLLRELGPDRAVVQPPWQVPPGALAGVDVVFLGEDDVRGQGDLVARLAAEVPVVLFTHGPRGAEVIAGGRSRTVGVYPTAEVDPTGAGDVFAAGFMVALAGGAAPVEAARLGAAAASVIVEGMGGATLSRVGEAWGRRGGIAVGSAEEQGRDH